MSFSNSFPVVVFLVRFLEVSSSEDFSDWGAISCAGDAARSIKLKNVIASALIEVTDTRGGLIRENDRAIVLGKPFNKTLLVFPTETASRVLCELDIVGRIRVDEVTVLNLKLGKVSVTKVPVFKLLYEGAEVRRVVDRLITAKGDIEMTRLIKPAEPVKASAVEVVEELSLIHI